MKQLITIILLFLGITAFGQGVNKPSDLFDGTVISGQRFGLAQNNPPFVNGSFDSIWVIGFSNTLGGGIIYMLSVPGDSVAWGMLVDSLGNTEAIFRSTTAINFNNSLYIDSIAGNIGVGTSSPTAKLHVIDTTTGSFPIIVGDSSANGYRLFSLKNETLVSGPVSVNIHNHTLGTLSDLTGIGQPNGLLLLDSITNGSVRFGLNNSATGRFSATFGFGNINSGNEAIVSGVQNLNTATASLVMGARDTITGDLLNHFFVFGGNNDVYNNTIVANASISDMHMSNNSRVTGNTITAVSGTGATPGIQFCELFDNCQITGNLLEGGDVFLWDQHMRENSRCDSNTLSGNNITMATHYYHDFDYVRYNLLDGNNISFNSLFMLGNNSFESNTLLDSTEVRRVLMQGSTFSNNTLDTGNVYRDIQLFGSSITNASGISITNVGLWNDTLDLTGRVTDLNGYYGFGGDVSIDGSVQITDGTQADGYVLTSLDNDGNATWQDPTAYGEMGFGDSLRTIAITQNVFSVVTNAANDLWSTAAVDLHNVTYSGDSLIVDSAGTYQVNVQLSVDGTGGSVIRLGVFLNGVLACSCTGYQELLNNRIIQLNYINIDALNAGDVIQVVVTNTANSDDVDAVGGKLMVNKIR